MTRRAPVRCAALLLAVASVASASALGEYRAESSFRSAREGYRFEFPRDHGSHDEFRTEWWYYTGHMQATDGRRFGYELTFFRRALPPEDVKTGPSRWSLSQLYLAHFAVTDVGAGRFRFAEKLSRAGVGKAGADSGRLRVWIDDWRAELSDDGAEQTLEARDGSLTLSLSLKPAKPFVVHGHNGVSRKGFGSGQASHYYSFTRLETIGTLTIGSATIAVTGTSWMDHEFGSAELGAELVGWDWFSLQLADQTEVMLYRLRRADGSADPVSSGTVVFPDGRSRHLAVGDVTVESTGTWTSPASRARYPSGWRIAIPSLALTFDLTPLVKDQELRTSRSTQVTYWEGAVSVSGTQQGRPVTGQGYVELTGYAERFTKKL